MRMHVKYIMVAYNMLRPHSITVVSVKTTLKGTVKGRRENYYLKA